MVGQETFAGMNPHDFYDLFRGIMIAISDSILIAQIGRQLCFFRAYLLQITSAVEPAHCPSRGMPEAVVKSLAMA